MKKLCFVALVVTCLTAKTYAAKFQTQTVYKGDDVVWGFDFLPNSNILITEKEGTLRLFDAKSKKAQLIEGVPKVADRGQGGLLDVLVDQNFQSNKTIYLTYSVPLEGGQTTRLVSASLNQNKLSNIKVIFTALPATRKTQHFGSRVVQDKDGTLFFTVGDRGERKLAQDKSKHRGKLYSVNKAGQVNMWSYGHRNAQGADFHPSTGRLWIVEHGPRGGDELNEIFKGKNYGWPVITYGKEYWGPSIGEGTEKEGMEQPAYHYTPSIAISGLMIYSGKMFPEWKNQFFIGALKDTHISRLAVVNSKFVEQEKLFEDNDERIRQIKEFKDGSIYYSTDNGKIIRLLKKLEAKSSNKPKKSK